MTNESPHAPNTRREIAFIFILFLAIIAIGVLFYRHFEELGWIDAIYFTTVTLTTLGYGDIVPQTDLGKLFTSMYALLGVGMFLGLAGIIFHNALAYSRTRTVRRSTKKARKK
jgi:voltage-gated potassium channel Kch